MDRRNILRTAVLTLFGAALQKLDIAAIQGGVLSVKMDDWQWIAFEHRGQRVAVPVAEVFKALDEAYGSTPIKEKR